MKERTFHLQCACVLTYINIKKACAGVVMATHSKAGEDVGSSADADSDYAVDPVEKAAVNACQGPINAYRHRSGWGCVCVCACVYLGGGRGTHLS